MTSPSTSPFDLLQFHETKAVFRERLWSLAPLIASGLIVLITVVRLLGVSKYNLTTAVGIIGTASPSTIVLGSLVLATPTILTMALFHFGTTAVFTENKSAKLNNWTYFFIAGVTATLISPWYILVLAVALMLTVAVIRRKMRKRTSEKPVELAPNDWLHGPLPVDLELQRIRANYLKLEAAPSFSGHVIDPDRIAARKLKLAQLVEMGNSRATEINKARNRGLEGIAWLSLSIMMPIMSYLQTSSEPWLAPEVITTKSGAVQVGYILKQDSKWAYILHDKNRIINLVKLDDISERYTCRNKIVYSQSLSQLIGKREQSSEYKECPDIN